MPEKGKIRIIGGKWKKSLITVPNFEGLRPTGNRQRETLFNWIENIFGTLDGKKALDMFSGSGALSFEWISRGGSFALLIEKNHKVASTIQTNIEKFDASQQMEVVVGDSFAQFGVLNEDKPFDMVFIDPPFQLHLQLKAAKFALPYLAKDGIIYLESPSEVSELDLRRIGYIGIKRAKAGFSYMLLATPIETK